MTRLRGLSTTSQASSSLPRSMVGLPEKQAKASAETATGTVCGRVSITARNRWNNALAGEGEMSSMIIIDSLEVPAPSWEVSRALISLDMLDSVRGANDSRVDFDGPVDFEKNVMID